VLRPLFRQRCRDHLSKEPGAVATRLSTRSVDPKALPQASSAFRSDGCENIPNIAPQIAAYIRMGMVQTIFGASTLNEPLRSH
jgi:hypothetical protein